MENLELRKCVAKALGCKTWVAKNGDIVCDCVGCNHAINGGFILKPYDTDNHAALDALEEFCKQTGYDWRVDYLGGNKMEYRVTVYAPDYRHFQVSDKFLALAICHAIQAAAESELKELAEGTQAQTLALDAKFVELEEKLALSEAAGASMRMALRQHGKHLNGCDELDTFYGLPCSCGLEKALASDHGKAFLDKTRQLRAALEMAKTWIAKRGIKWTDIEAREVMYPKIEKALKQTEGKSELTIDNRGAVYEKKEIGMLHRRDLEDPDDCNI